MSPELLLHEMWNTELSRVEEFLGRGEPEFRRGTRVGKKIIK
jgi:hypothetical protein